MAVHNTTRRTFGPQSQVTQVTKVIAPIGGIDATTILSEANPLNSIYSFNFVPGEFGLEVRRGYREWVIGIDNGNPLGIGTIIPYGGEDVDTTNDRLFVVSNEGIWDCTVAAAAPTLVIDFTTTTAGDSSSDAGYGVYVHITDDSGANFLFYADSRNGLFRYTESTDTWAEESLLTGPDMSLVDFVTVHKDQIWVKERDSSTAYYGATGAIAGAMTAFYFGSKFKHGGNIAGMYPWTIDGGEGVDDYFVIVSRAGDVIPYRGNDPDNDFTVQGQWFIGAIPRGPKFGTQNGGSLYLLSIYGLTSMDEIIVGVDGKNFNAETQTKKISSVVRNAMSRSRDQNGWQVKLIPSQEIILISEPVRDDGSYIQYARNITTEGWGLWRDVPMNCFDEWLGNAYFGIIGDSDKVYVMDTFSDNVLITPPAQGQNGEDIKFSLLSTFQDYGSPGQFKRPKYARSDFLSVTPPAVWIDYRYDYNLQESTNNTTQPLQDVSGWDISLWDQAFWDTNIPTGFNKLFGAWGMGRNVAIAMSGRSRVETTFIGWDVLWDSGAPL